MDQDRLLAAGAVDHDQPQHAAARPARTVPHVAGALVGPRRWQQGGRRTGRCRWNVEWQARTSRKTSLCLARSIIKIVVFIACQGR